MMMMMRAVVKLFCFFLLVVMASRFGPVPAEARQPGLYFGMKPKGTIVPPSGPGTRTSDSPPPPALQSAEASRAKLLFGMKPKGSIVPPPGPSTRTSDPPPPPPL
ncbi:hypothetical protein CRG98_017511 [Punica granatum]|uniref:Uncharacterized protein n=1 Tax=Punica granatum TaxID=22663 RepID=A0A2I0K0Q1_PUNGR|nr:hypothetical protein CRG98_017511 [Punica granatum]